MHPTEMKSGLKKKKSIESTAVRMFNYLNNIVLLYRHIMKPEKLKNIEIKNPHS